MANENEVLNQRTRLILHASQKAQINLGEFSTSILSNKASKEETLQNLSKVIEDLKLVHRAIEDEDNEQLSGCGVLSFSGECAE